MIPSQLHDDALRFCLVSPNAKQAFERGWTTTTNYVYTDPRLTQHIEQQGNYGVLGGIGNLLIVDFDDAAAYAKLKDRLPPTFVVQTAGKQLYHYYYKIGECREGERIKDPTTKKTWVDLQGKGTMVVGPGSRIGDRTYTVVNDLPIATTTYSALKSTIYTTLGLTPEHKHTPRIPQNDRLANDLKQSVKIDDLLRHFGMDTAKNPGMCVLGHPSSGGACLSYDDTNNLWHCFHCEEGGDIFTLWMIKHSCTFPEAKRGLAEWAGIDPRPYNSSVRIVTESGIQVVEDEYIRAAGIFYDHHPIYYDESGFWWLWNPEEYRWSQVDDIAIINEFRKTPIALTISSTKAFSPVRHEAVLLRAAKMVGRDRRPEDVGPEWLQFQDVLYNIYTQQTKNASPHYFCTNPISTALGDREETPTMDGLITEWCGADYLQTIYELIAYCCYREYPIHAIFCLEGGGRNGKSTLLRLIQKFVGIQNITSTELDLLTHNRFESFKLYKKLVCQMGETNFGLFENTSLLKRLVGQDLIGFEAKNKTPFDAYNYAKLVIASNSLPTTSDESEGFYRRWVIVQFPNQFPEGHDILEDVPAQEFTYLARKVARILPRLLQRGSFTNQGTIEERKKRYIAASNPLPLFVEERCEAGDPYTHYVMYNEFCTQYLTWLSGQKKRIVSRKEIKGYLDREGFVVEKATRSGNTGLYVLGLQWKQRSPSETGVEEVQMSKIPKIPDSLFHSPAYENKVGSREFSEFSVSKNEENPQLVADSGDSHELLLKKLCLKGLTELDAERRITELLRNGDIFQWKPGFYKPLR